MTERKSKTALVVEDDSDLRYVLSLRLIGAGYAVIGAANGVDALNQMETHSVDVVLTDSHMPQMDGLELLTITRVKWPGTPVVVVSGDGDDTAHEAMNRGAFAWLRKGNGFTTLVEILTSAIQQSVHA